LLLLLLLIILVVLFAHAHLIARLRIDGLLKNSLEHLVHVLRTTLRVDSLFALLSLADLREHLGFLGIDLLVAVHLKLVVLLLDLLLLRVLLTIFVIDAVDVGTADQFITVPGLIARRDFTFLVVVVNVDGLVLNVELSLLDLIGGRQIFVELELLRHLVDNEVLVGPVVVRLELQRLLCGFSGRRERHTAVDQPVGPVLVLLDDLVLLVEELFAEDQTILLPVMVEIEFAVASVNADHFLPVVELE